MNKKRPSPNNEKPPPKCPLCGGVDFTLGYMNQYGIKSGFAGFSVGRPNYLAGVFGSRRRYEVVTWLCDNCGYLLTIAQ